MNALKMPVISAFTLLLLSMLLLSCGNPNEGQTEDPQHTRAVPVRVQQISLQSLELSVKATGVLRSRHQIPISSEVAGKVVEKVRDIGDPVAEGDAILIIDPEPYELALAQAEARHASAQATYDQAKRDYARAEELIASEDISQFELETARLGELTALAALQMTEADLKMARRNIRLTWIVSPINGSVASLNAQIGQHVTPGLPLGTIVALDDLEIEVGLSERDIVNMKVGIEAEIRTDALPEWTFKGMVRQVGVAGLNLGRTFPVIVSVSNSSGLLRPGMIVTADIIYAQYQDVLAIPREALVIESEQPTLFVLDGSVARERKVSLGQGDGGSVIIDSGFTAGEQLIVTGQNVLSDSVLVEVL